MKNGISHWVDVRDKPGFLHRLMKDFAGNSTISLEGILESCSFNPNIIIKSEGSSILKRCSLVTPPDLDFVVLHLTSDTWQTLFEQINKAGVTDKIIHVQIERDGIRELGAYDNFHRDCVIAGPGVSSDLLSELKTKGVA